MPTRTPRARSGAGRTSGSRSQIASMSSLHDLFEEELRDLYSAEQMIIKALPKMADAASSPDLKQAFEHHLQETRRHVERLEAIFERQSMPGKGKKCEGIEGILKEGEEILRARADPGVKDAGLIGAAQKVEHYEMAGYGTVRTFAEHLGEREIAGTLQETLNEEGAADRALTKIARHINEEATEAPAGKSRASFDGEHSAESEEDSEISG